MSRTLERSDSGSTCSRAVRSTRARSKLPKRRSDHHVGPCRGHIFEEVTGQRAPETDMRGVCEMKKGSPILVSVLVLAVAQIVFVTTARTQPHAITQQSFSNQDSSQSIQAKGVEGIWQGTLEAGGAKLRLVLEITKSPAGVLAGNLDSLDQGAMDIPIESIILKDTNLRLEIKVLGGVYEGTLDKEVTSIVGYWEQGSVKLPLTFKRSSGAPPALNRPQEPKKPYPYDEQEVSYENKKGGVRLDGTLTLPRTKGPHPAVLLITGSGAQDRNETVAGHRPFLVLADYLTRRGIAVLRADDRGLKGAADDFYKATDEDFASDALAGVEFLKTRKEINS